MFARYKKTGGIIRNKVGVDCQLAIENGEIIRTEQSHKNEVDINKIIKRHGIDLINKTAAMMAPSMRFDDVTGNDFQEASNIILKATESFNSLPSKLRNQFDNSPAAYLDFVQNPDNSDQLIEMGLMNPPEPAPVPIEVVVTNPEAPPAE